MESAWILALHNSRRGWQEKECQCCLPVLWPEVQIFFLALGPNCCLFNCYGLTKKKMCPLFRKSPQKHKQRGLAGKSRASPLNCGTLQCMLTLQLTLFSTLILGLRIFFISWFMKGKTYLESIRICQKSHNSYLGRPEPEILLCPPHCLSMRQWMEVSMNRAENLCCCSV